MAVVTAGQDELARLTREAAELLPGLAGAQLTARPGLFAADGAAGRVVLLFPGEASTTAAGQDWPGPGSQPAIVQASLSALSGLNSLGVRATAALGHGVGEITGLVWAGSLAESDAAALVAQRAAVLAAPGARRTAMVCLAADAETALALQPGGELVIAAYHGPRCHVLACRRTRCTTWPGGQRKRASRRTSWTCPTRCTPPRWRTGSRRCGACSPRSRSRRLASGSSPRSPAVK